MKKQQRAKRSGPPPFWYDPRAYEELDPKNVGEHDSARSESLLLAWQSALSQRHGKWRRLDKGRAAQTDRHADEPAAHKMGHSIRLDPRRMPAWLVVPWGNLPAPPGLKPGAMFGLQMDRPVVERGDFMATLDQPGFSMWFNMDAPDDELREGFEYVLQLARRQWPSAIKLRGRGAANPRRISVATLHSWWQHKIIQLLDLDWYFAGNPDQCPTDTLLGRWLYGEAVDQPARSVNEARVLLRGAMAQWAPLQHTTKFRP